MDIQANKPVSGVSSSASAGGSPAMPVAEAPRTGTVVEQVVEVQPVRQDTRQTQQAIAEQVSRYLQSSTRNLEFQVDAESAEPVIVVRDGDGHIIRRIPGDEVMQLMRRANAESGTLIDSIA